MIKYIHIGYPKNFSTSLQRDYFSKHPDLNHLGVGLENNLGYKDGVVEKTLELYLKSCKYFKYNEIENDIINHFQSLFKEAASKNFSAVGVSAEHLGFSFTYDGLSGKEKAERLFKIFGEDTKILMIVRNQFDLIKSLYREYVRVGFADNFDKFIELLYKYQDRNFVYDFRYDYVYETYAKLFGAERIGVFFFEDYRSANRELIKENSIPKLFIDLNKFLEVPQVEMKFGHYNETIPSNKIPLKARLNKNTAHDLGNNLMESAEKHRIKRYLEEDLNYYELENETYSDVIIKRSLINKVMTDEGIENLEYKANKSYISFFKSFYEDGNEKFSKLLNTSIPKKYLNLNL